MAVYAAARSGGAAAALPALVAVSLAAALAVRAGTDAEDRERIRSAADMAGAFVPGALVAYLGFSSGGYYPDAVGYAAVALALLVAVRAALAERPFAGLGTPALATAGALAALVVWTGASGAWSDAEGRALVEMERTLLYALAFVAAAMASRTPEGIRRLIWGVALGAAAVCLGALLTRLLPDLLPTTLALRSERLSYPIGYWNGLGLLTAIAIVLTGHLAASDREPALVRVLAAAALPALSVTLYLTLSRGAILACVLGLVLYLVLSRPAGFPAAAVAAGPASVVAVLVAYAAEALTSEDPTGSLAVSQGQDVLLALGVLCALAAALRAVLLGLDARLAGPGPSAEVQLVAAAGGVLALALAWVAFDGSDVLRRQYERVVRDPGAELSPDARQRLRATTGGGRRDHWRSAARAFEDAPLAGQGAGTFETWWARDRPVDIRVTDAHSLYVEMLGELGLVGLTLLAFALGMILLGVARLARGPTRAPYAALLAATVTWAVHAGIDWDWELGAVTVWVFAAGGAALARAPSGVPGDRGPAGSVMRTVAVVAALAVAVPPLLVAVSQDHLDGAVAAYDRGDCATATERAEAARDRVAARAEPHAVLALCAAREGRAGQSLELARDAVARDPDDWQYRYAQALVVAAAGRDPGPALAAARRLNPREAAVDQLARTVGGPAGRAARARRILADPSIVR